MTEEFALANRYVRLVRHTALVSLQLGAVLHPSVAWSQSTKDYGAWPSPISAADAVASERYLSGLQVDGDQLYVLESRPTEHGRALVVHVKEDGTARDVTPQGFNVRTRVHEYGGGAYTVADGVIYFSNFSDGRLYAQPIGGSPQAITKPGPHRYGDCVVDKRRSRLICVREDHSGGPDPTKVINALTETPLDGSKDTRVLWSGADFVAAPRLAPDGRRLVFVAWNHPNMPWDATGLRLADLAHDGKFKRVRTVVAERAGESVMQPSWVGDGRLMFISDRSGWWNLYVTNSEVAAARPVAPVTAEIGKPAWTFGARAYAVLPSGALAAVLTRQASDSIEIIEALSGLQWRRLSNAYASAGALIVWKGRLVLLTTGRKSPGGLVELDPVSGQARQLYRPSGEEPAAQYVSDAQSFEFRGADGKPTFAWFYPPANPEYQGPVGTKPPVIVQAHGGPTAHSSPWYSPARNYWTSRGFAVLDVNYSGSSGFGTAYRRRLNGRWGELDVEDVVAAARAAGERGLVDPKRMVVSGGSAGGFVVLASLAFFPGTFAAGINLFGVSDLAALAKDTHKFESRYLDTLVGPLPASASVYATRSPMRAIDRFAAPLLTLQGQEDKIVPPSQSEIIASALKSKGRPVAYLLFQGEGHGFRNSESLVRSLEAQQSFLGQTLGFKPADAVPELKIDNWPQGQ
jgi:dipeptidyl aminopeptidase/acylaminoacyl peptidase